MLDPRRKGGGNNCHRLGSLRYCRIYIINCMATLFNLEDLPQHHRALARKQISNTVCPRVVQYANMQSNPMLVNKATALLAAVCSLRNPTPILLP